MILTEDFTVPDLSLDSEVVTNAYLKPLLTFKIPIRGLYIRGVIYNNINFRGVDIERRGVILLSEVCTSAITLEIGVKNMNKEEVKLCEEIHIFQGGDESYPCNQRW